MSKPEPLGCQERRHDDLAAYALGALHADEARELEDHLAGCATCGERLRWLEPAVDLVPATVQQLEPPPSLRASLMADVGADLELTGRPVPDPSPEPERVGILVRLRELIPMRPALAGLAVVAVLIVGVGGYLLGGDEQGLRTYAALPESPRIEASGTLEVGDGQATLVVEGLPRIGEDRVFQAWVAQDGQASPSSVFVARTDGSGSAAIPNVPDGADSVLVTIEPAGGSETPQTAPVLRADID